MFELDPDPSVMTARVGFGTTSDAHEGFDERPRKQGGFDGLREEREKRVARLI